MIKHRIFVGLCLLLLGSALWAGIRHQRARTRLWSDAAGWRGGRPRAGGDVVIPRGETVVLDGTPPPLGRLRIDGTLVFQDRDVALTAREIDVRGALVIGQEHRSFRHKAIITLTGAEPEAGAKALMVDGGTVEMHGASPAPAWTHLGRTAPVGARVLTLAGDAGWRAGQRVVVASTDFDPAQAETRVITDAHGATVTLDTPLRFPHWGRVVDGVDERAEVGCLSRRIVVQGDAASEAHGYGGHLMVMDGGTAHLDGVEFVRMGQRGRKGCYPVHFHRLGDARGCYVRDCAIHHCYNRCLTIHGTRNVWVVNNIGCDTIGHCFFLEDGSETGNVFVHNLGLSTRAPAPGQAVLDSDDSPATFWITNPDNTFRDNVAAGSAQYGFWLDLPKHPTNGDDRLWPRRTRLGEFSGNVAHSNGHTGLFVDNGPNAPGVYETPNYEPPQAAVFRDMTAYKNRRRGLWLRGHALQVTGARLADNAIGVTLAASESSLTDSRIVGETDNTGTPAPTETTGDGGRSLPKPDQPRFPIRGFEFYDGLVSLRNVAFAHFRRNTLRPASALGYLRFTPFFIDPHNSVMGARFTDAVPVYFDPIDGRHPPTLGGDGYRSAVFVDGDGSVTGSPGGSVVVNNPFLLDADSRLMPSWGAAVSMAPFGRLFIDDRDTRPQFTGPVRITRLDSLHPAHTLWGVPPDQGPATSFQTTLISRRDYAVRFQGPTPAHVRLALRFRPASDWVTVSLPAPGAPMYVYGSGDLTRHLVPVPSRAAMLQRQENCYYRTGNSVLVKLVVPPGRTAAPTAVADVCTQAGCRERLASGSGAEAHAIVQQPEQRKQDQ